MSNNGKERWLEIARERAERHAALERDSRDPDVARDGARLSLVLREMGALRATAEAYGEYARALAQRDETVSLLDDPELGGLAQDDLKDCEAQLNKARDHLRNALISEEDESARSCIIEIRAGTGGEEARLFVQDLFTMYTRVAEARRWRIEILNAQPSDMGGYKEIIFGVSGKGAYEALRFEAGGHRVQRVPATESQGRIHTSACTLAVLPEVEEVEVNIRKDDLVVDTFRASGPGGQKVNKTESAIRITHVPTGTVVAIQDQKSQHQNRDKAMRVLRARISEHERRRAQEERAAERREQTGTGDRSDRVRTYNFPQNRVTDHRIGENFPLEQFMAGNMDRCTKALQDRRRIERLRNME